jgi:nucleoside 2-deoxyribosyltransferase
MLVYLAGPIAGLPYKGAVDWRQKVTNKLATYHINTLSPMRHKIDLGEEVQIQDSYEHLPLSSRKGLTARDRYDVMRCDLVLFNFLDTQKASIGSCIEVGWADAWRKPMVAVITEGNVHYHAMIRECAGFIVPTLREAVDLVQQILLPDVAWQTGPSVDGPIPRPGEHTEWDL